MLIKEFAQITNLSAKTIRYYEEIGLLPPPNRLENGYRVYGDSDVARARFVAAARNLDLSLNDVQEMLALRDRREAPCRTLLDLLAEKADEISRRITFTDPQVASAGLTEAQAREQGYAVKVSELAMSHVPRALAARDTRGLIKLVADADSDRLLGAHILAPEGGELIQTAVLAIQFGITVSQLRRTIFPYLTNVEGIKLATLGFEKDVTMLSCCAG